jgi:hypothetical protein
MFRKVHAMWENETIVLITSLKKRLLADNKKVRFSKISADPAMPPFIKALFQGKVESFIKTESPITIQSTAHFDLSDQDLADVKERFLEIFREAASFSSEEVSEVLQSALMQRMDYLVKPVDTMRRLLFNGGHSVTMEKMMQVLNPFLKILPYADQLLEECRRLNYQAIESDEYNNLMNELFDRMVNDEPVKLAVRDFSVLTDFVSETKGEDISRIEGQLVQEFMADRNLWGFRRAIEVEMKLGKEDFDLVDLEMTLRRYLELKADFSESHEKKQNETQKKVESEILQDIKNLSEPGEEPDLLSETTIEVEKQSQSLELTEVTEESFDLDEIIQSEDVKPSLDDVRIVPPESEKSQDEGWDLDDVLGSDSLIQDEVEPEVTQESKPEPRPEVKPEPVMQPKPPPEPEQAPKTVKPPEKTAEPEIKQKPKKQMRIIRRDQNQPVMEKTKKEGDIGESKLSVMAGLRQMIDSKTEKIFVKKLFANDQNAYDHLIKKLEESESWRVAKILIDNELFKRDVDPFSREAIKLVDLVYSRYYPEEGVGGK